MVKRSHKIARAPELEVEELERWVDSLDLKEIRENECVQRLKHVRLLGTMRYVTDLTFEPNRYEHSLGVAYLADAYLRQLEVGEKVRKFAVLVALLHDIGHLPFSHASEVFFKEAWGQYHTGRGSRLARLLSKTLELRNSHELAGSVRDATRFLHDEPLRGTDFVERALNAVFHGVLSADTLDGISKAATAIGLECPNTFKIIEGVFREGDSTYLKSSVAGFVETFLALKEYIYKDYVYSASGMAAEAMLTKALHLGFRELVDKDEFLRYDDEDAYEQLLSVDESRTLMEDLEGGRLFCSLKEVATEKYRVIREVFLNECSKGARPAAIGNGLEVELNPQIGDVRQTNIIIHPTIRLKFSSSYGTQLKLFDLPAKLDEINRNGKPRKHYGVDLEVFVRPSCLSKTRRIHLQRTGKFVQPISSISAQRYRPSKLERSHGAVPTPEKLVRFLTRWAITDHSQQVLDPASGDGVFMKWSVMRFDELGVKPVDAVRLVHGIEREKTEREKSLELEIEGARLLKSNILSQDFFDYMTNALSQGCLPEYDVIVGNPPYIRAHKFDGRERALECCRRLNVQLSGRVSSWAPYVACCIHLLKSTGRFAMVLPVELLSTDYAKPVRELLSDRFSSLKFVFFKQSVFTSALQNVLLLLASNDTESGSFRKEVKDENSLSQKLTENMQPVLSSPQWLSEKWTNLLTDQPTLEIIEKATRSGKVTTLGDIANIKIGQVTGCNKHFIFSPGRLDAFRIEKRWVNPIVTRAALLCGAVYDKDDFQNQLRQDLPSYLLAVPPTAKIKSDQNLTAYIDNLKREGIHMRHKCRTRWPWYSVPTQPPPDGFLTYMSHSIVRFVLNAAGVGSTNNIHNIYFKEQPEDQCRRALTVAFYSTLTQLSIELLGRSYGGGVLKVEPGEACRVLLVHPKWVPSDIIKRLSHMFDEVDSALKRRDGDVFSEIDDIVLHRIIGLTGRDVRRLQSSYKSLREQRLLRSK